MNRISLCLLKKRCTLNTYMAELLVFNPETEERTDKQFSFRSSAKAWLRKSIFQRKLNRESRWYSLFSRKRYYENSLLMQILTSVIPVKAERMSSEFSVRLLPEISLDRKNDYVFVNAFVRV